MEGGASLWDQYHYARFLSHLAKNRTADHAAEVTRLGMELFGGLGFLEEYAVARWHREALITPIWEEPSNIQALDFLEAMQKEQAHEAFVAEFVPMLEAAGTVEARECLRTVETALARLRSASLQEAQWYAKDALARLADAAQVALLYRLASLGRERYALLASLYCRRFLGGEEYPAWMLQREDVWSAIKDQRSEV